MFPATWCSALYVEDENFNLSGGKEIVLGQSIALGFHKFVLALQYKVSKIGLNTISCVVFKSIVCILNM